MAVTIKPIGNRVLIKPIKAEQRSEGGLLLPESAQKKEDRLEVIALGTGNFDEKGDLIEFPVNVGDVVMIDRYAGQEINVENEIYLVVRVTEIIAVL